MATISEKLVTVNDIKMNIKAALQDMDTNPTNLFATYPEVIKNIPMYYVELVSKAATTVTVNGSEYLLTEGSNRIKHAKRVVFTNNKNITFAGAYSLNDATIQSYWQDGFNALRGCGSGLTTVDISDWPNTMRRAYLSWAYTPVTEIIGINLPRKWLNLQGTFEGCLGLKSLDLTSWDTSSAGAANSTFYFCRNLKSLDVSTWDVQNFAGLDCTFSCCNSLQSLDLSKWQIKKVNDLCATFYWCYSLSSLGDISQWDTSKCVSFSASGSTDLGTFSHCSSLKKLDLSGWDTSAGKSFGGIFAACYGMGELILGPGWGSATGASDTNLMLDFSSLNSYNNYELSDATWESMLTMFNRLEAGYDKIILCYNLSANIPEGFIATMSDRGYTINLV